MFRRPASPGFWRLSLHRLPGAGASSIFFEKFAGSGHPYDACRTIGFDGERPPKTFASCSDRYRQ
jgi:hypothetical protein